MNVPVVNVPVARWWFGIGRYLAVFQFHDDTAYTLECVSRRGADALKLRIGAGLHKTVFHHHDHIIDVIRHLIMQCSRNPPTTIGLRHGSTNPLLPSMEPKAHPSAD